jgi:hypothetical protein
MKGGGEILEKAIKAINESTSSSINLPEFTCKYLFFI